VSQSAKDMILKLLVRKPNDRLTIEEVLDHQWIVGEDASIQQMRRKSLDAEDHVMQFVAYSNTSVANVEKNSPKMIA
jgi:serine/threonine protein kinase